MLEKQRSGTPDNLQWLDRPGRHDAGKWHRDALDIVDNSQRIRGAAAGDFLSVIAAGTDDALLRFKCLDVVRYLNPCTPGEFSPTAVVAMDRLREYCEAILSSSNARH
jgi:hypothetical protein